jgi:hypothetical protein
MSVIVTLLAVGFLALRHTAGRALAGSGLITTIVIVLGGCLFAAGVMVVSATTIRHRRAAAGACHTCRHPCAEQPDLSTPVWPHRPLSRGTLPVIVVPRQAPAPEAENLREREAAR